MQIHSIMGAVALLVNAQTVHATETQEGTSSGNCKATELARGVISSTGHEVFRGSFSADGKEFFFFRSMPGEENYGIFVSRKTQGNWQRPEHLMLGTFVSDFYPSLSLDGRTLIFSSYRTVGGGTGRSANANFWLSSRTEGGWSEPQLLSGISQLPQYDNRAHFLADGTLRFSSTSADWSESNEYVSRMEAGAFSAPELDQDRTPFRAWAAEHDDLHLWNSDVSPDGTMVILEVSRTLPSGRPGPADLWYSVRSEAGWTEPRPMGAVINTADGNENFPTFTPDGETLTFVRDFRSFYTVAVECVTQSVE